MGRALFRECHGNTPPSPWRETVQSLLDRWEKTWWCPLLPAQVCEIRSVRDVMDGVVAVRNMHGTRAKHPFIDFQWKTIDFTKTVYYPLDPQDVITVMNRSGATYAEAANALRRFGHVALAVDYLHKQ